MLINIKKVHKDAFYKFQKKENLLFLSNYKEEIIKEKSINIINTGIGLEVLIDSPIDIQLHLTKELMNNNLYMLNYPATIDQDYRGELKIIIYNFNYHSVFLEKNTFISKVILNKIPKIDFIFNK
jgi:dUTP pyrophosphatase